MSSATTGQVPIATEGDLVTVRQVIRQASSDLGFGLTDVTRIVTAASELARNTYVYAKKGVMHWHVLNIGGNTGIEIVFEDNGPGIPSIEQAMQPGFSSGKGYGLGLPGAKRLMDEMDIQSEVNIGTTVTVRKFVR